ncbi:hypothetical protein C8R43DRAFT_878297 [Mycena crocata]|nr:hypothetical protein C8R43DRAFT_878297 [Mycena crocata]
MSAEDFVRAFHRGIGAAPTSTAKATAFRNYLVSGSEADTWFKALPAATKLDMDLIEKALEEQYPTQETVQPTAAEYGVRLVKEKLRVEELGTRVKVADREAWAHHAWPNRMLRLATNAGVVTTNTYIEQVRLELPRQLRTKVASTFADWPAFVKAIRAVDAVELEAEMKEWREDKEKQDRMAQLLERQQALQASPTAGIRAQMSGTRIGAPIAAPRWPQTTTGANPFQGTGAVQPPLEGEPRRLLLEAIQQLPHHPDTPEGRRAHGDQQQEAYRLYGNTKITVNTPYLLRPGRAPLNSGECFRCGFMGHTNYMRRCEAPVEQCLGPREQQWRRVVSQALKEPPMAVRAVGFTSWDVDDYGRPFGGDEGRFEEVDDQGNA